MQILKFTFKIQTLILIIAGKVLHGLTCAYLPSFILNHIFLNHPQHLLISQSIILSVHTLGNIFFFSFLIFDLT